MAQRTLKTTPYLCTCAWPRARPTVTRAIMQARAWGWSSARRFSSWCGRWPCRGSGLWDTSWCSSWWSCSGTAARVAWGRWTGVRGCVLVVVYVWWALLSCADDREGTRQASSRTLPWNCRWRGPSAFAWPGPGSLQSSGRLAWALHAQVTVVCLWGVQGCKPC